MKTAQELLQLANDLKRFLDLSDHLRVLHETSVRSEWQPVEEEAQQLRWELEAFVKETKKNETN